MSTAVVIGAGRMARVRLAALTARNDVDRCVVITRDPERAGDLARGRVEVTSRSASRTTAPDVVFVASATNRHEEDLRLALGFDCPILCEKPLAHDSGHARELAELAHDRGIPLYVAFQRHFEPALHELRRRLDAGELGVLYHLRFTHLDRHPGAREFIAASGGIFKDLLHHDIECALWLTRRTVRAVYAAGSVRMWDDYADFDDCDTATVLLTLDDGLTVTLHGSRHHPIGQDARVEAIGSSGACSAGLTTSTPIDAIDAPGMFSNHPAQSFQQRFEAAYVEETNAFVDFSLGATDFFDGTTAAAAVEALLVAEACRRSHDSQQVVPTTWRPVVHQSASGGEDLQP